MKKRVLILLSACIALCVSSFGSTATAASKRTESFHKRTIDASIVVPPSDGAFHDGLLLAMKSDGQRVYYHLNGQIAFQLPAEVTPVSDFSAQRAIVKNNITNLMGFVNTKGDLVTPLQYEEADSFSEGVAYVKCNGEKYLIDRFGRTVQRLHLDVHSTYQFKDGLATAYDATTGEVGYINKAEQVIIPLKYRAGRDFSEGLALVQDRQGNIGYVNASGKMAVPLQYKSGGDFNEGLAPVQHHNGLWGYINTSGKVVIPFRYASADSFSEGLAAVANREGHIGYINSKGKWIIPYTSYNRGTGFKHGFAVVGKGDNATGTFGYINRVGRLVTKLEYRSESVPFNGMGIAVAYKVAGIAHILTP